MLPALRNPFILDRLPMFWEIKIYDNSEKLVCISRITVAVLKKKQP